MATTNAAYSAPLHLRATTDALRHRPFGLCGGCTVMTDCLPSGWSDGRSNTCRRRRPVQNRVNRRTKRPSPSRRRWTLVSPGRSQYCLRPCTAVPRVLEELRRHRQSRQHALIFGLGASGERRQRASYGGAAPCSEDDSNHSAGKRAPGPFLVVPDAASLFLAPTEKDVALWGRAAGSCTFRAALHFRIGHAAVCLSRRTRGDI
jgi:hypothetical protein